MWGQLSDHPSILGPISAAWEESAAEAPSSGQPPEEPVPSMHGFMVGFGCHGPFWDFGEFLHRMRLNCGHSCRRGRVAISPPILSTRISESSQGDAESLRFTVVQSLDPALGCCLRQRRCCLESLALQCRAPPHELRRTRRRCQAKPRCRRSCRRSLSRPLCSTAHITRCGPMAKIVAVVPILSTTHDAHA